MRPAFASTSDPSGSRRATNRVTARDPRPKSPGSLPFLPSFLCSSATTDAHLASTLPSLLLSVYIYISLLSIPLLYSSLFFCSPQLLASFFARLVGITTLAAEGTWLPGRPRAGGKAEGKAGGSEMRERERERPSPARSTALTLFSVRDRE